MRNEDEKIKAQLLKEIKDLNISVRKKMRLLRLLDWAFRDNSGLTYFSEKELAKREQLYNALNIHP